MNEFKTFMSLTDTSQVDEILSIFEKYKLDFKTQDTSKDFDPSMAYNKANDSFLIMLKQQDFEKASQLLEENLKFNIDDISPEHPFFTYNRNELEDVIINNEDFHPLDVRFAKYLMQKNVYELNEIKIKSAKNEKNKNEIQHEKSNFMTLFLGYFLCFFGGLAGLAIALYILFGKKTLKDGAKIYVYPITDRLHGLFMILLAIVTTVFYFKLYN